MTVVTFEGNTGITGIFLAATLFGFAAITVIVVNRLNSYMTIASIAYNRKRAVYKTNAYQGYK